jgi:hypothetical protein
VEKALGDTVEIRGPTPSPIEKAKDEYRFQIWYFCASATKVVPVLVRLLGHASAPVADKAAATLAHLADGGRELQLAVVQAGGLAALMRLLEALAERDAAAEAAGGGGGGRAELDEDDALHLIPRIIYPQVRDQCMAWLRLPASVACHMSACHG